MRDWSRTAIVPITLSEGLGRLINGEKVYGQWFKADDVELIEMGAIPIKRLTEYQLYITQITEV